MNQASTPPLKGRRRLVAALAALPAALGGACTLRPLPPPDAEPADAAPNTMALRPPRVGQSWTVRQRNLFNGETVATLTERLTAVGAGAANGADSAGVCTLQRRGDDGRARDDEVHDGWGRLRQDPAWEQTLQTEQPVPLWPQPLQTGPATLLHTRYQVPGGSGWYPLQAWVRALRWERVTVPAGSFVALRVERLLRMGHPDPWRLETQRTDRLWIAPEVGRWVLRETSGRYLVPSDDRGSWMLEDHERWELVAWR